MKRLAVRPAEIRRRVTPFMDASSDGTAQRQGAVQGGATIRARLHLELSSEGGQPPRQPEAGQPGRGPDSPPPSAPRTRGSTPAPSSTTEKRTSSATRRTRTVAVRAPAYFATFCRPSAHEK